MNFKEVAWLVVLGRDLPFVSVQHRLRRQLGLVQFVCGQDETTLLVDERLPGRDARRQGSFDMVDDLDGWRVLAWAPPLGLAWERVDGALGHVSGLQVLGKTRQRLSGIRFTGKSCGEQGDAGDYGATPVQWPGSFTCHSNPEKRPYACQTSARLVQR
jgi:hypothetical protein